MEYLPFGETLVEEHLNSNNSPFKFNAKELDCLSREAVRFRKETGNYYYGARYGVYPEHSRRDPKWSIPALSRVEGWLSVDPLAEMYPTISSYAYVMQNPVRYTDPTGMVVEDNGCGFGCKLRKFANKIIHPDEPLNPNTGRLSKNYSRATGAKLNKKKSEKSSSERRDPAQIVNSIERIGVIVSPTTINLNFDEIIPRSNFNVVNNDNAIVIDNERTRITGPTSVSFEFANLGSISHFASGKKNPDKNNQINPLSNNARMNLEAIARFLNRNPQATIRFQYPTIPSSMHPNVQDDTNTVYGMSFMQISNFLKEQGVENLNKRVLKSSGSGFDVILNNNN